MDKENLGQIHFLPRKNRSNLMLTRTKPRPGTKTRSASCTGRYDNQHSGHKRPIKQHLSRSASSSRELRRVRKVATPRSLHPSPELLTSDTASYQEVNLTKRPRPARYSTPQTLKFTTDATWSTPVAKPQRPAHMSKNSTMSSVISNAITVVSSRCQAKETRDKNPDDPPLVLSELNNTGSSTLSAEATQFIVDQLMKTDASITDLTKKIDCLAQAQAKSQCEQTYNGIDISSSDLQRALSDNDALRAKMSSMTQAFIRDTAETRRKIAATCSLSSALRSALEKSAIHSMELENKLAAKETQLQRLQWINKSLTAKLSANPRIGITRPNSTYSSRKFKSIPTYETPEKRRRCSSARQEPGRVFQAATPAIVISQSLLESLDDVPEQKSHLLEGTAHRYDGPSVTSYGLPEVLDAKSIRHFSPPSTPQLHTKALPISGRTVISHKKTTHTTSSFRKSATASSSSKRASTHKPRSPQSARQSALETYAQTALANEVSLWRERCTEKDLLVESLERQANELKERLKEKETQLVSVQQQTMNVLAEKKLLVDELSRVKTEADTREAVTISVRGLSPEQHYSEKRLEDKVASLEADLSSKDILIADLMAQLQSLKSINEQPSSSEAIVSPSHVSIPTSNVDIRTTKSSPSPLTSTSVLRSIDNQSPADSAAELETQLYKVCANSPVITSSQPLKASQTKIDKKEIKRLMKQEKKQEKLMRRAASNSSTSAGSKKGSRASSRSRSAFSHCGGGSTLKTEIQEEIDYVNDPSRNADIIATAVSLTSAPNNNIAEGAYTKVSLFDE